MKKNSLLPPISPQDRKFAKDVVRETDLPLDEIMWFVGLIRAYKEGFSSERKCSPHYKTIQERILNDSDFKISEFSINGSIKIDDSDPLVNYLDNYLRKNRNKLEKRLLSINQQINTRKYKTREPFIHIIRFFDRAPLVTFKKYVGIGMFLAYFKLYSREPIMTRSEFGNNPTDAAQDYNHYLNERVRSLLKSF